MSVNTDPLCTCGHLKSDHINSENDCEAIRCKCIEFEKDLVVEEIEHGSGHVDLDEEPAEPWERDDDWWKNE